MLGRPVVGSASHLSLSDHLTLNGDVKRKRGRPRTLDGPQDDNACFGPRITSVSGSNSILSSPSPLPLAVAYNQAAKLPKVSQDLTPLQAALNRSPASH